MPRAKDATLSLSTRDRHLSNYLKEGTKRRLWKQGKEKTHGHRGAKSVLSRGRCGESSMLKLRGLKKYHWYLVLVSPSLKEGLPVLKNQTLEEQVLYLSCRPCDNAVRLDLQALPKTACIPWVQQPETASTTIKKLFGNRNRKLGFFLSYCSET